MRKAKIKLQTGQKSSAVTIPKDMIAALPGDMRYFSAVQYYSGKIMLTPINPGDDEK